MDEGIVTLTSFWSRVPVPSVVVVVVKSCTLVVVVLSTSPATVITLVGLTSVFSLLKKCSSRFDIFDKRTGRIINNIARLLPSNRNLADDYYILQLTLWLPLVLLSLFCGIQLIQAIGSSVIVLVRCPPDP